MNPNPRGRFYLRNVYEGGKQQVQAFEQAVLDTYKVSKIVRPYVEYYNVTDKVFVHHVYSRTIGRPYNRRTKQVDHDRAGSWDSVSHTWVVSFNKRHPQIYNIIQQYGKKTIVTRTFGLITPSDVLPQTTTGVRPTFYVDDEEMHDNIYRLGFHPEEVVANLYRNHGFFFPGKTVELEKLKEWDDEEKTTVAIYWNTGISAYSFYNILPIVNLWARLSWAKYDLFSPATEEIRPYAVSIATSGIHSDLRRKKIYDTQGLHDLVKLLIFPSKDHQVSRFILKNVIHEIESYNQKKLQTNLFPLDNSLVTLGAAIKACGDQKGFYLWKKGGHQFFITVWDILCNYWNSTAAYRFFDEVVPLCQFGDEVLPSRDIHRYMNTIRDIHNLITALTDIGIHVRIPKMFTTMQEANQFHDELARLHRTNRHQIDRVKLQQKLETVIPYEEDDTLAQQLHDSTSLHYSYQLAQTGKDLYDWSDVMRNCISSYLGSASSGECYYIGIYDQGVLIANAEIERKTKLTKQLLGKRNDVLPKETFIEIMKHFKSVGLIQSYACAWGTPYGIRTEEFEDAS